MPQSLNNTSVLVTGADGFIGSHLVQHLVQEGARVRAMALYNSQGSWGWLETLPADIRDSVDIVLGDIRDSHSVHSAMSGCDIVFHLAALIAIPYSYQAAGSYVDTNVTGTLNILQAARAQQTRVIQTSTSEVYGTAQFVPMTEAHPLNAQSPYAATKIASDQLALSYHRSFELPVCVVRPFNTYGPRQSARAVLPTIITQLAQGATTLKIGAISPTRDFNYIDDTVRGFIAVAKSDNAIGEVINLGTAQEISIGQSIELICEIMNKQPEIVCDERRVRPEKSEVERLYACNEKACRLLDWSPEYVGLDGFRRGLRQTVDWFSDASNLAHYHHNEYTI